jgi:hypothetical protein
LQPLLYSHTNLKPKNLLSQVRTSIKEYLKLHPYELVFAILMADAGEPEILEKIAGSESAAFNLLKQARAYGETARLFPIHDYPIK